MSNPSDRNIDDSGASTQRKTWQQRHSAFLFILIFCAITALMIVLEKTSQ
jgi:hypothetical protein